jgi:uncharacterized protein (TIGR02722 family)
MTHRAITLLLTPVAALALAGCGSQVIYDDPESLTVSGDWSDTDIRAAASELGAELAAHPAIANATGKPRILALHIKNRSSKRLNTSIIISQIETRLLAAGKVEFIDGAARPELAKEYEYMASGMVDPNQQKGPGRQAGADYLLWGTIENVEARQGRDRIDYYYIKLTLLDVERNTKVWQGEKKIKKRIRS